MESANTGEDMAKRKRKDPAGSTAYLLTPCCLLVHGRHFPYRKESPPIASGSAGPASHPASSRHQTYYLKTQRDACKMSRFPQFHPRAGGPFRGPPDDAGPYFSSRTQWKAHEGAVHLKSNSESLRLAVPPVSSLISALLLLQLRLLRGLLQAQI